VRELPARAEIRTRRKPRATTGISVKASGDIISQIKICNSGILLKRYLGTDDYDCGGTPNTFI
jgi:hypothetical protein